MQPIRGKATSDSRQQTERPPADRQTNRKPPNSVESGARRRAGGGGGGCGGAGGGRGGYGRRLAFHEAWRGGSSVTERTIADGAVEWHVDHGQGGGAVEGAVADGREAAGRRETDAKEVAPRKATLPMESR